MPAGRGCAGRCARWRRWPVPRPRTGVRAAPRPLPVWSLVVLRRFAGEVQLEIGLQIGCQLFHQGTKCLLQCGQRPHEAIQFACRKCQAVGLRDTCPVLHDHYNTGSSGLARAVHSAPAKTTIAAMKLHSRIATECRKMAYSRSSFACRNGAMARFTYLRASRISPTKMAAGATRAGGILRLGSSQEIRKSARIEIGM